MNQEKDSILVVVDIQPGYHTSCHLVTPDIIEKINTTEQPIFFFYVGKDFDLDKKDDVICYLLEHGLDENRIPGIRFIEKAYGFFRPWMDTDVSDDITLKAVTLMHKEKIYDSRDFEHEHWQEILGEEIEKQHILFEEPIFYPDFNTRPFESPSLNKFELIGGGRQECLKEIEIFLQAIGKEVSVNEQLCYGDTIMSYETDHKALKRMRRKK